MQKKTKSEEASTQKKISQMKEPMGYGLAEQRPFRVKEMFVVLIQTFP